MTDCLLMGDSIAVGLFGALRAGGLLCALGARIGATSGELPSQIMHAGFHPLVILSAGTNDAAGAPLEANLFAARRALSGARVIWVLPYKRRAAYAVTQVAFRFGDDLVDLAAFPTRDRIHPSDYHTVADALPR